MLITLSGPPGSGTTTAGRLVAEALGLARRAGGEEFRALAAELGLTVHELGQRAARRPEIDVELDRRLVERAREGSVVLESRLAGWLVTRAGLAATRVWIDCDEDVRAARVAGREGTTVEAAREENRSRGALERRRYRDLYDIDLDDLSVYDLVMDSGILGPAELADRVVALATAGERGA
ncbi:MAG: (d)CMP kinase [Acidimicrobiia bacterium]